ncbi:glycosyltransferase family 2 protein [Eubacterium sp. MSJ-33]|uniref:glycosyltransferase family 2 protein n=1 Tax=Eubacterium sp. MSJ-33 TaxID=2841528 RepID=UPI001C761A34|nr:glycosyltransferase family 2 protein [Eubacterium sp. MSJ-33]QWT52122.1 glycosyltransferase family 2 protein [Eubacterium sp. MSJ-33]
MKKLSVMIPCYNEEDNVREICKAVIDEITKSLPGYDYEILFIDNDSKDKTRIYLREMCQKNKKVRAIFNAKNFGQFNSPYYGMCHTTGDCTICLCCDFQDPVEMIPQLVKEWENGAKIVCAIKTTSKENKIMRFLRTCYYKMIKKLSDVEQIEHFTGFGLYDKSFIDVLKNLDDSTPFLRGIVAELGYKRVDIPYEQQKRKAGKTHNNWATLYDAAMLSFTSYTKAGLRIATIMGFVMSGLSLVVALVYLILKLVNWDSFSAGTAPILLAVCVLGSVQLFFIGLMGEYVLSINKRMMHRPLVIEEERLNFDEESEGEKNA